MGIEQEIKQTSFSSSTEKLVVNLLYTSNWIGTKHDQLIKEEGLTGPQFNVLRILRGQKGNPIGIGEITSRMLDKMSNTSRLVDKLETKELVVRIQCPNDRRAVRITITPKGLEILAALDPKLQTAQKELTSLSETEIGQLNDLLDKLRK
jgi:DNA-binding MarR family transcriptional regulator